MSQLDFGWFSPSTLEKMEEELEKTKVLMGHTLALQKAVKAMDDKPEFVDSLEYMLGAVTNRFMTLSKQIAEERVREKEEQTITITNLATSAASTFTINSVTSSSQLSIDPNSGTMNWGMGAEPDTTIS